MKGEETSVRAEVDRSGDANATDRIKKPEGNATERGKYDVCVL